MRLTKYCETNCLKLLLLFTIKGMFSKIFHFALINNEFNETEKLFFINCKQILTLWENYEKNKQNYSIRRPHQARQVQPKIWIVHIQEHISSSLPFTLFKNRSLWQFYFLGLFSLLLIHT